MYMLEINPNSQDCMHGGHGIVQVAHANSNNEVHKIEKETIKLIKTEWCTYIRRHGILLEYVRIGCLVVDAN